MSLLLSGSRARRRARVAVLAATGALFLSLLTALPAAHAAVTSPTAGATLSGIISVTESGGTSTCTVGDKAESKLAIIRVADGATVHTASRSSKGALTTSWNSVGSLNGEYRIESQTRNSVRSGLLNLGCTAESWVTQPAITFTVANQVATTLSAPSTVITGEAFTVDVTTVAAATGVNAVAADVPVTLTVPGVGTRHVITNAAGQGSVTFTTPGLPYLPAGTLPIEASADSTPYFLGDDASTSIELTKRATGVIYSGDTRAQPDTRARIGGVLIDLTESSARFGDPLVDQPVTLDLDGDAADVLTTASGRAVRSVPVTGQSRIIDTTASFAGNDVWQPSSDTVSFFVGDAVAPEAPVEHATTGGYTRAVGNILGFLLSPVRHVVNHVVDAAQSVYEKLVNTLLGAVGTDLASLEQANLLHLASPAQLNSMLNGLLDGVTTAVSTAGDPIDATFNRLVDTITGNTPLADLADTARYTWRSVYVAPNGSQVTKEFGAIMEIPEPLDVTGDGVPDVMASVIIGLDLVPKLKVATMSGAPADLPLSLQAVLTLPGNNDQYRFGYDTRTTNAPKRFEADIVMGDAGVTLQVAADSGQALAVTGAIAPAGVGTAVTPESSGEEADADGSTSTTPALAPAEMRFGVSFDPAPVNAALAMALPTGGSSPQDIAATLTTDRPTTVGINLVDDSGTDEIFLANALIEDIDGTLELMLNGSTSGTMAATFRTDDGLDSLSVNALSLNAGRTESDIRLAMTDVPDTVEFDMGADGQGYMSASGPIGVFEAAFATGGKILTLTDDAYLRVFQKGDRNSIALRLPGFEGMNVAMDDSISLGLTMQPTPLRALVDQDGLALDARITDAPHHISLGLATDGNIEIVGSAPIDSITLTGHNPDGIAMGATDLSLTLTDVPTRVTVSVDDDGAAFTTAGGEIGLMELLAGSGTLVPVPGTDDGLIIHQGGPEGLSLAARISGVRTIQAIMGDNPDIVLDTTAGNVFLIQMLEQDATGAVVRDVSATIDHLVPNLRLGVVDDGTGAMSLRYSADEPTNSLTIQMGGMSGSIADPLPARLDVCIDGSTACLPHVSGVGDEPLLGSISFSASEYTTLNLVDPGRDMAVTDLRVRRLDLTGDLDLDEGGPLYLNTALPHGTDECDASTDAIQWCEQPIKGGSIGVDNDGTLLTFTPGNGFSAIDAVTDLEVTKTLGQPSGLKGRSGTGRITCVSGTALKVTVSLLGLPITLDVKGAICNTPTGGPRDESGIRW